jgi:hypothetical protein
MSESFNFEYCRCCTCGYEWRKGLDGSHSCAENLERQLADRNRSHIELHKDYNKKYNECEDLQRQLAEAREENKKLTKWMLETHEDMKDHMGYEECPYCMGELFDDISIKQLKEKNNVHK